VCVCVWCERQDGDELSKEEKCEMAAGCCSPCEQGREKGCAQAIREKKKKNISD
jgi:hypothetical protein